MKRKKIAEALKAIAALPLFDGFDAMEMDAKHKTTKLAWLIPVIIKPHLLFMCDQAAYFLAEGRREKCARWTGFVLGALWGMNHMSIDEAKDLLRPDPADDAAVPDPMFRFFVTDHLPIAALRGASRPFCDLAEQLLDELPNNAERAMALRKLLEAKDCAVRSGLGGP